MEKKFYGFIKKDDVMVLDNKYLVALEELKAKRVSLKGYCNVLQNLVSVGSEDNVAFPELSESELSVATFENEQDIDMMPKGQKFNLVTTKGKYHGAIIRIPMKLFELYGEKYLISLLQRIARSQVNERNKTIATLLSGIVATPGIGLSDVNNALNNTLSIDHVADAALITNRSGYHYLIESGAIKEGDTTYLGKEIILLDNQVLADAEGNYSFYVGTLTNKYVFIEQEDTRVEAYENLRNAHLVVRFGEMYDVIDSGENSIIRIDITK